MKEIPVMLIFVILIALLNFQLSCGTTGKYGADGMSRDIAEGAGEVLLLGDKHKAMLVECNDCHEEAPPSKEVPKTVCLTCHESFAEPAVFDKPYNTDPHNAHFRLPECGNCHHAHWQSQNHCLGCHDFGV